MKRAISGKASSAVLAAAVLAACSPATTPEREAAADAGQTSAWTRPPEIHSARREPAALVFAGLAQPRGRVVLRSDAGDAYAVGADTAGRFEIRMTPPTGHLLLRPETQVGQDAATSPDRLLILAGGRGPLALLRSGAATRRLDAAPALGAIDSDGRMRVASGRAQGPVVVQAGGATVTVTPDASGHWSVMLRPSDAADQIQVGDERFDWPGPGRGGLGSAAAPPAVEALAGGWRVDWAGPDGARQSTWLPRGG